MASSRFALPAENAVDWAWTLRTARKAARTELGFRSARALVSFVSSCRAAGCRVVRFPARSPPPEASLKRNVLQMEFGTVSASLAYDDRHLPPASDEQTRITLLASAIKSRAGSIAWKARFPPTRTISASVTSGSQIALQT